MEQNPDHSVLESNITPFIQSEKANQAMAGLQTGLEKHSVKALDLNQHLDSGVHGNGETSIMDSSLNDTT